MVAWIFYQRVAHTKHVFSRRFAPGNFMEVFCRKDFSYKDQGKPVQHFIQHYSPMLDEMLDEKFNVGWSIIFGLRGFFHPTIERLKIFIVPFILSKTKWRTRRGLQCLYCCWMSSSIQMMKNQHAGNPENGLKGDSKMDT